MVACDLPLKSVEREESNVRRRYGKGGMDRLDLETAGFSTKRSKAEVTWIMKTIISKPARTSLTDICKRCLASKSAVDI